MRSYGMVILLGLSQVGCETIIDVDLKADPPRLVVLGRFEEGQAWHIVVQRTVAMNERVDVYPAHVEHATVTIRGDDGTDVVLTHRGGGFYDAGGISPVVGVRYWLTVEAEGFSRVEASDQIPEVVPITHTLISSGTGRLKRQIEVEVDDPGGIANYYEFVVLEDSDWSRIPFTIRNPELGEQLRSLDAFDPFEPSSSPVLERAVIHDGPFDGRTFRFRIETEPWYSSGDVSVHVRALSRSAFEYEQSKLRQEVAEDNPLVEPVPVRTNVLGGQGIFAGAATQTIGTVTPEFMLREVTGAFRLRSYAFEGGESPFDYVFHGGTGRLTLGSDFSVEGELLLHPRYGDDEPRRYALNGGFLQDGNVVHLYHGADTALRDMSLRYNLASGTLSGSLSANAAVRVYAQFGP